MDKEFLESDETMSDEEIDEDEFGELTRLLLLLEDDEICFDLCELLIEDDMRNYFIFVIFFLKR